MSHNETYERYWNALDPTEPDGVKSRILQDAYHDSNINGFEYQELTHRAFPEVFGA